MSDPLRDRFSTAGYFKYSLEGSDQMPSDIWHLFSDLCFDDLVVIARGNTPDPIPNSAVKTLSADGTPS
jgi:hypothetical protein